METNEIVNIYNLLKNNPSIMFYITTKAVIDRIEVLKNKDNLSLTLNRHNPEGKYEILEIYRGLFNTEYYEYTCIYWNKYSNKKEYFIISYYGTDKTVMTALDAFCYKHGFNKRG